MQSAPKTAIVLAILLCTRAVHADSRAAGTPSYADLSLEDLMAAEIVSVARKRQRMSETAAAVFIIDRDDIRRSGARSIPDLLRLVPGMEVAQIDAGEMAISARGFNSRLSTKLLVLIDGRWVYTPAAGSVLWAQVGVPLEQIERIEVIRGPGAATWGANAVNAVINIITVHTADSIGGKAAFRLESNGAKRAFAQYGASLDESSALRLHAEVLTGEPLTGTDGKPLTDEIFQARAGLRADRDRKNGDAFTLQAEISGGSFDSELLAPLAVPPFLTEVQGEGDFLAGHLLARWTRILPDDGQISAQAYIDHFDRTDFLARSMADFEVIATMSLTDWSETTLGGGYRLTHADFIHDGYVRVDPQTYTSHWFGAFVQNDARFLDDRLKLSLGARLEHNDFSGFEFQPSARILFSPLEDHLVWGAVSWAARTRPCSRRTRSSRSRLCPLALAGTPVPCLCCHVSPRMAGHWIRNACARSNSGIAGKSATG